MSKIKNTIQKTDGDGNVISVPDPYDYFRSKELKKIRSLQKDEWRNRSRYLKNHIRTK
jgi:hypothetical protein